MAQLPGWPFELLVKYPAAMYGLISRSIVEPFVVGWLGISGLWGACWLISWLLGSAATAYPKVKVLSINVNRGGWYHPGRLLLLNE